MIKKDHLDFLQLVGEGDSPVPPLLDLHLQLLSPPSLLLQPRLQLSDLSPSGLQLGLHVLQQLRHLVIVVLQVLNKLFFVIEDLS